MTSSKCLNLYLGILAAVFELYAAIPIDNGVTSAEVSCTDSSITVNFGTKNPFMGRIFVKGMVDNPDCVRSFQDATPAGTTGGPAMTFEFGRCNMQRSRTLSPQKGMMQSIVVIISFHPIFITKVDKAYRVQCFYMEAEKTVTSQLEVSMLTTEDIQDTGRMPTCSYTVRRGSKTGEAVQYARVGEPVYHEWECDSDSHSILIKNCFVDDGQGNKFQILDERGCAIDPVILSDLTYENVGNAKAWVESHVFKFADRPTVFFQCTVQLCNRNDAACTAITPPTCPPRNAALVEAPGSTLTNPVEQTIPNGQTSLLPDSSIPPTGSTSISAFPPNSATPQNGMTPNVALPSIPMTSNGVSNGIPPMASNGIPPGPTPTIGAANSTLDLLDNSKYIFRSAFTPRGRFRRELKLSTLSQWGPTREDIQGLESNEMDLYSNAFGVLDIVENVPAGSAEMQDGGKEFWNELYKSLNSPEVEPAHADVCISRLGFGFLLSLIILVILMVMLASFYIFSIKKAYKAEADHMECSQKNV